MPTPAGGLDDDGPDLAHLWATGSGGLYRYQSGSFTLEVPVGVNESFGSLLVLGDDVWVSASISEIPNYYRTVIIHRAASGTIEREIIPGGGNKLFRVGDHLWVVGEYLATRPLP